MEFILIEKFLQFILGGCITLLGYKILFKNAQKLASSKLGSKKDINDLIGNDGIKLSKDIQLSEKMSMEHPLVLGPTGAGKTTSLFFNQLLDNKLKGTIIVSDPKGELYRDTHKYQESLGRKTILFTPLGGHIQYNLLENCRNDRDVMKLAQSLLINGSLSFELQTGKKAGGIEWLQMSQGLLTAALLYVRPHGTIKQALKLIIDNDFIDIDRMFSNAKESVRTQYNTFKMCLDSPKTMGSIKISLASNLTLFTDDLATDKNNFTPKDLRDKETVLYISYPENQAYYLSPFMAPFYSQLIDQLIDSYKKDYFPVYFLFDEFANLGQLSSFSLNIATARSRKISFTICLQSITQLIQIYGKENAYAILNNAKTKLILPGLSDIETLRYASELCGETEIQVAQPDGKIIKTTKTLFAYDEIRRLDADKLLIIISNRLPILAEQDIYYTQTKYLKNVI